MAFDLFEIFSSIESADILKSSLSTSARTGVALQYNTEFAVATNVISGIITSSFLVIPIARNDN